MKLCVLNSFGQVEILDKDILAQVAGGVAAISPYLKADPNNGCTNNGDCTDTTNTNCTNKSVCFT